MRSLERTARTFATDETKRGKGLIPGDGRADARRALGGTDDGSGPVEDDKSRQEEW